MKTWEKKKLTDPFTFPRTIDMSKFTAAAPGERTFCARSLQFFLSSPQKKIKKIQALQNPPQNTLLLPNPLLPPNPLLLTILSCLKQAVIFFKSVFFPLTTKLATRACSFDLQAVLVHRGPSAQSGHYVVHVLDLPTNMWFEFDDNECKVILKEKNGYLPLGEPLYDPYRSGSLLEVPCFLEEFQVNNACLPFCPFFSQRNQK
jgi:hypothetical protein